MRQNRFLPIGATAVPPIAGAYLRRAQAACMPPAGSDEQLRAEGEGLLQAFCAGAVMQDELHGAVCMPVREFLARRFLARQ